MRNAVSDSRALLGVDVGDGDVVVEQRRVALAAGVGRCRWCSCSIRGTSSLAAVAGTLALSCATMCDYGRRWQSHNLRIREKGAATPRMLWSRSRGVPVGVFSQFQESDFPISTHLIPYWLLEGIIADTRTPKPAETLPSAPGTEESFRLQQALSRPGSLDRAGIGIIIGPDGRVEPRFIIHNS